MGEEVGEGNTSDDTAQKFDNLATEGTIGKKFRGWLVAKRSARRGFCVCFCGVAVASLQTQRGGGKPEHVLASEMKRRLSPGQTTQACTERGADHTLEKEPGSYRRVCKTALVGSKGGPLLQGVLAMYAK